MSFPSSAIVLPHGHGVASPPIHVRPSPLLSSWAIATVYVCLGETPCRRITDARLRCSCHAVPQARLPALPASSSRVVNVMTSLFTSHVSFLRSRARLLRVSTLAGTRLSVSCPLRPRARGLRLAVPSEGIRGGALVTTIVALLGSEMRRDRAWLLPPPFARTHACLG